MLVYCTHAGTGVAVMLSQVTFFGIVFSVGYCL